MKPAWLKSVGWVALAVVAFAGLVYLKVSGKRASESQHQKVKTYVAEHPALQPSYDRAMSDGKLTLLEAKAIFDEGKALSQQGKAEPPPEVED